MSRTPNAATPSGKKSGRDTYLIQTRHNKKPGHKAFSQTTLYPGTTRLQPLGTQEAPQNTTLYFLIQIQPINNTAPLAQ